MNDYIARFRVNDFEKQRSAEISSSYGEKS